MFQETGTASYLAASKSPGEHNINQEAIGPVSDAVEEAARVAPWVFNL